jgi:hypothetical protein
MAHFSEILGNVLELVRFEYTKKAQNQCFVSNPTNYTRQNTTDRCKHSMADTSLVRLRRNADRFAQDSTDAREEEEDPVVSYDSEEELDLDAFVRQNTDQNEEPAAVEDISDTERRKQATLRRAERKTAEEEEFEKQIKPELLMIVQQLGYSELSKYKPNDEDQTNAIIAPTIFDAEHCKACLRQLQEYLNADTSANRKIWRLLASWKFVEHELLTILVLLRNTESFNEYAPDLIDLLVTMTTLPLLPGEEKEGIELDDDQADVEGLGTREERQRSKNLNFQHKIQLPILQQIKKAFLNKAVMISLIETVMRGFVKAIDAQDENVSIHPEAARDHEDYTISVMTLLVNLLKISDAKPNIATSSDVESNMQELFIKLLKESHALELIIVIVQYLIDQRNSTSNTIFAKAKLLKWYMLSLELITLLIRNEVPTDLFSATSTTKVLYTTTANAAIRTPLSPVNEQPRQVVVTASSDYSKKLLREAMAQEQRENTRIKASIPTRHSRFGGSYVRHNDVGNAKQQRKTMTISSAQVVGGKVKFPTKDTRKSKKRGADEDQENKDEEDDDDQEKTKKKEALAQPSQFVFHNINLARERSLPQVKQAFSRAKMLVEDEMRRKPS